MVFKKIIFQNRYVELETPPFMEKNILNFHFDYLTSSLSCHIKIFLSNHKYLWLVRIFFKETVENIEKWLFDPDLSGGGFILNPDEG